MEFTVAEKPVFTERVSHLCKRLEKSEKELTREGNRVSRPKIQDIPRYMAEKVEFQRYYKPQIISLNALHATTPQGELYKEAWAAMYLKDTNQKVEDLYMEICYENASYPMDIKPMWRNLHSEVFRRHLNPDNLIMDGCCVLQLLKKSESSVDPEQELKISIDKLVRVHQDLLIMDNQIHFQLLRLLCEDEAMLEHYLRNFLQVHGILIESSAPKLRTKKKENQEVKIALEADDEEEDQEEEDPVHLLDYLRRALLKRDQHKFYKDINNKKMNRDCLHLRKYRIGTIRELKAAGISLRKYPGTNLFFPKFYDHGVLELPELIVDGSTAHIFLNLVAYEMCPDFRNSFEISSFLVFMSFLIDQPEDVKELRMAGIIINELASDKEVADVLNKMDTVFVPETALFALIRDQIQWHFESKRGKIKMLGWMGEAYNMYFRSPWAIIALLAAALGLVLTLIQTWFTVHPKSS